MNRQKLLVIIGAAMLVLFLKYRLVNWLVIEPMNAIQKDIKDAQATRGNLEIRLKNLQKAPDAWHALAARALHSDRNEAQRRFYGALANMLDHNGLREDLNIRPLMFRSRDLGKGEQPLIEVPVSVTVRGTLEQLTSFLLDFYKREYLARIDSITITGEPERASAARSSTTTPPPAGGRNGGRGPGGRSGPGATANAANASRAANAGAPSAPLTISLTATALVVPGDAKTPVGTNTEGENSRLPKEADAYQQIAMVNIFKEYVPPIPKPDPPQPAPNSNQNDNKHIEPVKPIVNPREGKDKIVLVGTAIMDDQPVVFIRDIGDLKKDTEQHHLNESVDDGTLVLVHPKGMVVRVPNTPQAGETPDPDEHDAYRDYFYALGKSFKDREEFNPEQYPDVAHELELAFSGDMAPAAP